MNYPMNFFFDEKSSFPGGDLSFHCPDLFSSSSTSDASRVSNSVGCKRRKSENALASSSSSSSSYCYAAALHHSDPAVVDTRPGPPAAQPQHHRRVANLRERDRAHSVNSAFTTLRALIPTEPADRKLSKIETIRLATSYISHLQTVLVAGSDCVEQPCMRTRALAGTTPTAKEASPTAEDDYRETASLAPICTFCLSASKTKTKTINTNRSESMPSSREYVYDWIAA